MGVEGHIKAKWELRLDRARGLDKIMKSWKARQGNLKINEIRKLKKE